MSPATLRRYKTTGFCGLCHSTNVIPIMQQQQQQPTHDTSDDLFSSTEEEDLNEKYNSDMEIEREEIALAEHAAGQHKEDEDDKLDDIDYPSTGEEDEEEDDVDDGDDDCE